MSDTLRITHFAAADCGGHWLSFASDDEYEFYRLVGEIKALGRAHAMYDPDKRAWWLSPQGLARLCGRDPELAWLLGEFLRAGAAGGSGGSSDAGGASGGSAGGKRKRASSAGGGSGGQRKSRAKASAAGVPADVALALAVLYVTPDAPVAVVKAVYKAMAKLAYPYVQGTADEQERTERMKVLNLAYETAETWAAKHGARLAGVGA